MLKDPPPSVSGLDLQAYLEFVDAEYGTLPLTGLLKDRASAAVPLDEVYVTLLADRPAAISRAGRGAVDEPGMLGRVGGDPVEALAGALGGDRDAPEVRRLVTAALRSVGVPAEEAAGCAPG